MKEMVNHPAHYKSESGLEVIEVMNAFTSNLVGIEAVDTSNIIKYICRWKNKNGLQDLEKAKWYLEHLIEHVKEEKDTIKIPNRIVCSDLRRALEITDKIFKVLEFHGVVSVANLCHIIDEKCDREEYYKFGWYEISTIPFDFEEDIVTICLPEPVKIK